MHRYYASDTTSTHQTLLREVCNLVGLSNTSDEGTSDTPSTSNEFTDETVRVSDALPPERRTLRCTVESTPHCDVLVGRGLRVWRCLTPRLTTLAQLFRGAIENMYFIFLKTPNPVELANTANCKCMNTIKCTSPSNPNLSLPFELHLLYKCANTTNVHVC